MNKKQRKKLEEIVRYKVCEHVQQRKARKAGTPGTTEFFYYYRKNPSLIPGREPCSKDLSRTCSVYCEKVRETYEIYL